MTDRIDLTPIDPDHAAREDRIADRVMRTVRTRRAPRRPTLADEIMAARVPALVTAAGVALLVWIIGTSTPADAGSPIGVASALGIPTATAALAQRDAAPTLRDVLTAFGQTP